MQGYYGSYTFADNAIVVAQRVNVVMSRGGEMVSQHAEYDVRGYLKSPTAAGSQSEITAAVNALITALAIPYQDFALRQDDGANSSVILSNDASINGVTVKDGPNFVESTGAELNTERAFTFTIQADYPISGSQNILLEFQESLEFFGGGPKYVIQPAVAGGAQKQQALQSTGYFVIQRGSSVGYLAPPPLPAPLWPADLLEAPRISPVSAEKFGKGYQGFRLSWSYSFGAVSPFLFRQPNQW